MQALAHDTDEELTDDSRPLDALMSDASMEEEGRGGLPVFKTIMGREIQGAADVDASWFSMSQFRAERIRRVNMPPGEEQRDTRVTVLEFDSIGCLLAKGHHSGMIDILDYDAIDSLQVNEDIQPTCSFATPYRAIETIKWNPKDENQIIVGSWSSPVLALYDLTRSLDSPYRNFISNTSDASHLGILASTFVETRSTASRDLIAAGGHKGVTRMWDLRSSRSSRCFAWKALGSHDISSSVVFLEASSSGDVLIAMHEDGTVQIWDIRFSPSRVARFKASSMDSSKVQHAKLVTPELLVFQKKNGSVGFLDIVSGTSQMLEIPAEDRPHVLDQDSEMPADTGQTGNTTVLNMDIDLLGIKVRNRMYLGSSRYIDPFQWMTTAVQLELPLATTATAICPTNPVLFFGTERGHLWRTC